MKHGKTNQSHPHPNDHGARRHQTEVIGNLNVTGVIQTELEPALEEQRHAAEEKKDFRDKRRLTVEITTLVALIIYAGVAAWQGYLMYTSNVTTREALTSVQRAFIFPSGMATPQAGKDGKSVGTWINVRWENSGTTPTRDLTIHFSNKIFDGDMPADFNFPDLWSVAGDTNKPFVLPPKGVTMNQGGLFLADLNEGIGELGKQAVVPVGHQIYLWGWAKYRDVFDGTSRHITEYCYHVVPIPQPPVKDALEGLTSISFEQCRRHNCQDTECEDYKEQISQ